tara:strand:- start:26707 stop:29178 length:2472 start_codon:yes stop_codon:yes gene_type:complete
LVKIAEEVAISKKDVIDKKTKETLDLVKKAPSYFEAKKILEELISEKRREMSPVRDQDYSINAYIFYCMDFLIRTSNPFRVDLVNDFCMKENENFLRVFGITILHLSFFHGDIELSKFILRSELKDQLFFFRSQHVGGRYSPIIMKAMLSSETELIDFLEELKQEISADDLLRTGLLHLAASSLKDRLFSYLVNVRKLDVNYKIKFDVYMVDEYEKKIAQGNTGLISGYHKEESCNLLGAINFGFVKRFVVNTIYTKWNPALGTFVESFGFDYYKLVDIEFDKSTATYYFQKSVAESVHEELDNVLKWLQTKGGPNNVEKKLRKFKLIFRTMIANDYKIGDESSDLSMTTGFIGTLGTEAIALLCESGYKANYFNGVKFTFDLSENYKDDLTNSIFVILEFMTRADISSEGNLNGLCEQFRLGFKHNGSTIFNPESIPKEERVLDLDLLAEGLVIKKRKELADVMIRFNDLFGIGKDEIFEYRGQRVTFLDYLKLVGCPGPAINNAIDHGFLTKNQIKNRRLRKALSEAVKEQKRREEIELQEQKEREEKEKELARIRTERKRKERGPTSFASYSSPKKVDAENALELFESALANNDYELFKKVVHMIDLEHDVVDLSTVTDSRVRKNLIRRGLKVSRALFLSILELDQYDVMKVIVNERERDRSFVRMVMLDIKDEDIEHKVSDDMLFALGGFRGKFVAINRKFDEEDDEEVEEVAEEERKIYISKNGLEEMESFSDRGSVRDKLSKKIEDMRWGRFRGSKNLESIDKVRELRILGGENIRIYYKLLGKDVYILKIYEKRYEVPIEELKILDKQEVDQFQDI